MTTPQPAALPELQDFGPWHVSHDGKYIDSDNFNHDVKLVVQGDFRNDEQRRSYSLDIAKRLSRPALAALQSQPAAAGVSDAEIDAIWRESLALPCSPHQSVIRFARAILALRPQSEPVGEAGTMPGTSGFTMACFHADKVPVGTKLYADALRPQSPKPVVDVASAWSAAGGWVPMGEHAATDRHYTGSLETLRRFSELLRPQAVPMTEADLLACVVKANCLGGVPLSNRNGHYHIDAPSDAVVRLKDAIEAHHGITAQGAQGGEAK